MRPSSFFMPVALAALLLTGCTPTEEPAATTTPSVSEPSPSASETPEPPRAAPQVPFDGDCSALLDDVELEAFLGATARTEAQAFEDFGASPASLVHADAVAVLGGLSCRWFTGEDAPGVVDGVTTLGAVVLPVASVPDEVVTEFATAVCDPQYDATYCRYGETVGDAWILVRTGPGTEEPPTGLLSDAVAAISANLPEEGFPGARSDRQDTWWALPACADLGTGMDLGDVIGTGYRDGYWESTEQPEERLVDLAGVARHCPWSTGDERPADGAFYVGSVTAVAGAAWEWDAMAAVEGLEAVDVADAQGALHASETGTVFATDGVNVVEVQADADGRPASADVLTDLAARALTALAG